MGGNNRLIVCCFPNSFHAQDVARNDAYKMYLNNVAQIKCVNLFNCVWIIGRRRGKRFPFLFNYYRYSLYIMFILQLFCVKWNINYPYNHSNNVIFRRKLMSYDVISSNIFFAHLHMMELCVYSFRLSVKSSLYSKFQWLLYFAERSLFIWQQGAVADA